LLHHAAPLSTSYFFFFHRSRPHRDLHSFPTRRSSDLRFAKPDSRNQAQDHRAQRGNETQREVSTGVVFETIFTREQVQEPLVERSEEHTSELQSRRDLVCRLLLEKKKKKKEHNTYRDN